MRWFWIDRFVEFHSGQCATAIKNVTLAEEHLHDHFPGAPLMPGSLVIEGLAQTGGLLVGEHGGFAERIILAKIAKARLHFAPVPGDTLTYRAIVQDISKDGAVVSATSHVGERLQAEADIFFAKLDASVSGESLYDPAQLLAMLHALGVFAIGRTADGQPLSVPPALAAAAASSG
jgi:3-hydroxyacyl-[acyl-carrier-protein] dehydratase